MRIRVAWGNTSLSLVVLGGTGRVAETFVRPQLLVAHYEEHRKLSW